MLIRSFGSSALAITFAASILACATAACTVKTTGTGPVPSEDGGKSADDDDDDKDPKPGTNKPGTTKPDAGKTPTSTGTSCQEIISCVSDCTGDGCEDECYAAGSTAGKAQVDAILACAQANGCEDSDCIAENCAAEAEACK